MNKALLTGILCFLMGIGIGYLLFEKSSSDKKVESTKAPQEPAIWVNESVITYDEVKDYLKQRLRITGLTESKVKTGIKEITTSELLYQKAIPKKLSEDTKITPTLR